MRKSLPCLPLSAFLFVSLTCSPQLAGQTTTPAPPTSDPQAIALATKALAALTGNVQISDVTLTGTATRTAGSDVETGTVTLRALGTGESRMDLATSSGTRSEIRNTINGSSQGTWVGLDGTSHAMANHNCLTDASWFFPGLTVLSQLSNPNLAVAYVGQEIRAGNSVQHLHFASQFPNASPEDGTLAALTAEDVYLDSTSQLPLAIVFNTHADNDVLRNIPVEIDFSNYQVVNGVQVPFRVQQLLNGSMFLDITIQSATLNSSLSDADLSAN